MEQPPIRATAERRTVWVRIGENVPSTGSGAFGITDEDDPRSPDQRPPTCFAYAIEQLRITSRPVVRAVGDRRSMRDFRFAITSREGEDGRRSTHATSRADRDCAGGRRW